MRVAGSRTRGRLRAVDSSAPSSAHAPDDHRDQDNKPERDKPDACGHADDHERRRGDGHDGQAGHTRGRHVVQSRSGSARVGRQERLPGAQDPHAAGMRRAAYRGRRRADRPAVRRALRGSAPPSPCPGAHGIRPRPAGPRRGARCSSAATRSRSESEARIRGSPGTGTSLQSARGSLYPVSPTSTASFESVPRSPARPDSAAVLGGQHPRPVVSDRDGVLEMRGPAAIGGHHGPPVLEQDRLRRRPASPSARSPAPCPAVSRARGPPGRSWALAGPCASRLPMPWPVYSSTRP